METKQKETIENINQDVPNYQSNNNKFRYGATCKVSESIAIDAVNAAILELINKYKNRLPHKVMDHTLTMLKNIGVTTTRDALNYHLKMMRQRIRMDNDDEKRPQAAIVDENNSPSFSEVLMENRNKDSTRCDDTTNKKGEDRPKGTIISERNYEIKSTNIQDIIIQKRERPMDISTTAMDTIIVEEAAGEETSKIKDASNLPKEGESAAANRTIITEEIVGEEMSRSKLVSVLKRKLPRIDILITTAMVTGGSTNEEEASLNKKAKRAECINDIVKTFLEAKANPNRTTHVASSYGKKNRFKNDFLKSLINRKMKEYDISFSDNDNDHVNIPVETIRSRLKSCKNPFAISVGVQSPLKDAEEFVYQTLINTPLTRSETIQYMNQYINGTQYQQELIQWQKKHYKNLSRYGKVGYGWYYGYKKRFYHRNSVQQHQQQQQQQQQQLLQQHQLLPQLKEPIAEATKKATVETDFVSVTIRYTTTTV